MTNEELIALAHKIADPLPEPGCPISEERYLDLRACVIDLCGALHHTATALKLMCNAAVLDRRRPEPYQVLEKCVRFNSDDSPEILKAKVFAYMGLEDR